MTGETNLSTLLRSMQSRLHPDEFVFVTIPPNAPHPQNLHPLMRFEETEGTTLILRRAEAEREGLPATFPCRMITLDIHSSLEAVGFLAAITTRLAAAGIPVNPVSAFSTTISSYRPSARTKPSPCCKASAHDLPNQAATPHAAHPE